MSLISSTRQTHVTSHGLGGFLRGAGRIAIGAVTGGPAGAIAAGASLIGGRQSAPAAPGTGRFGPRIAIPRFGTPQAPSTNGAAGGSPGPGYHLNKSDYFLRDGTFVPKGTRWVKNRRRNAMNPKALTRAIQRVDAGKSWQAKLAGISTSKYTSSGKRKDRC